MPPKAAQAAAVVPTPQLPPPSPSPPPAQTSAASNAQDLLVIHDIVDTLDQIPFELTKVHSDLNELGAVLYSTLLNLETKLNQLVKWIQDPSIGPAQRFQLLQEIAEEAARYKLGGDDKIRVAGGACDGILNHQNHLKDLLDSSTLLDRATPSPYTAALTLESIAPRETNTRRNARTANSPFGGRGYAAAANGTAGAGADASGVSNTPSKKKKGGRVQQLGAGARDDDDVSVVGGEKKRPNPQKKRKTNRAVSPADSLASASAFTGTKPVEPRTARQLAAAANKARKAEREDADMSDDSRDEPLATTSGTARGRGGLAMQTTYSRESGLGLDVGGGGSKDSSGSNGANGGKSGNGTPLLAAGSVLGAGGSAGANDRRRQPRAGAKRARGADADDDSSAGGDSDDGKPSSGALAGGSSSGATKRAGGSHSGDAKKASSAASGAAPAASANKVEDDGFDTAGENDPDVVYCLCQQPSYGEMIACDTSDCELEWYHLGCVGLTSTPDGNWICPRCIEKGKNKVQKPAKKAPSKPKARK